MPPGHREAQERSHQSGSPDWKVHGQGRAYRRLIARERHSAGLKWADLEGVKFTGFFDVGNRRKLHQLPAADTTPGHFAPLSSLRIAVACLRLKNMRLRDIQA